MSIANNPHLRNSLNGTWKFRIDPAEKGLDEQWYIKPDTFEEEIVVPGTIQEQKAAYRGRYDSRRTQTAHESFNELDPNISITLSDYRGVAWYMREFTAPDFTKEDHVWLCLDAVHPMAVLWIDGRKAGEHRTGPLEHCRLDITKIISPGKIHRLAVMVTEEGRLLQGVVKWPYFSGIYKDVYLEVTKEILINDVFVRSDINTGHVSVAVAFSDRVKNKVLACEIIDGSGKAAWSSEIFFSSDRAEYELDIMVPDHQLWSPTSPNLYTCIISLTDQKVIIDAKSIRFGFRHFSRYGKQLYLNGKPLFLRGTGFAGAAGFPDPGPNSCNWYRKIVARAKEYGFNYLRWHTYSMEQGLLDAADELGLLIQSELFSVYYETVEERDMTREQCRLMLMRNRNHPSVACFAMGNEHDGTSPLFTGFRDSLCQMARKLSPDTLVMDSDGIGPTPITGHEYSDIACVGIMGIGSVLDMSPAIADMVYKNEKPYLIHEFGYPESFPQTEDIPKYSGGLRPFWLEHTLKSAKANKVERLLPTYVNNSRRLHFRIVKKAIEDARKVDGLAGYGHWGFHDFVHESIGLVDIFMNDKGGSATEFQKANGEIALAMTPACDRFTCYQDEPYEFELHLSNHSGNSLSGQSIEWKLIIDDDIVASSESSFAAKDFGVTNLGRFSASGPETNKPYTAILKAGIKNTDVNNEWNLWFYPRVMHPTYCSPVYLFKDGWQTITRMKSFSATFNTVNEAALWEMEPTFLLISPLITDAVADFIKRGGRVLLLPTYYVNGNPGLPMLPSSFGPMPSFAGSIGGCGTVINDHAIVQEFPNEGWCDYQWFDLIGGERVPHVCAPFHLTTPSVFDLGKWPVDIQPIIRSIPNWKKCNNRAYLFEVAIGNGKLLASSMRVFETMFTNPESAWLLDSMLRYTTGDSFTPKACVTIEQFERVRVPVELTSL